MIYISDSKKLKQFLGHIYFIFIGLVDQQWREVTLYIGSVSHSCQDTQILLIVEDPAVTVKCRKAIKMNLCLSVMLDKFSCSFTSISCLTTSCSFTLICVQVYYLIFSHLHLHLCPFLLIQYVLWELQKRVSHTM